MYSRYRFHDGTISQPGNYVNCLDCGNVLEVPGDFAEQYFLSKPAQCEECGNSVDWWETILTTIRDCPPYYYDAFAVLNIQYSNVTVDLVPNAHIEIQPAALVPPDSNILNVMYGSRPTGLLPLEDHGYVPNRHSVPDKIKLYAARTGQDITDMGEISHTPEDKPGLDVFIAWLPKGHDDTWQSLYQALEAYTYERYESAVVTANTALNLTIDHIIRRRLKYGYKLNVLLPRLITSTGYPELPDHIHSALDRLRDYRNKVVHEWVLKPIPSREDIAECLCAAAFGVNYLKLVQSFLQKQRSS